MGGPVTIQELVARMEAAGYTLALREDGGVRVRPVPPPEVVAELRGRRPELEALLGGSGSPPVPSPEAAGELAACDRENALLRRVETGLGAEVDAALWRVVDRLLDRRDLGTADAVWKRVVNALDRGILSRLVGWLRSLDRAGDDHAAVLRLVSTGPGHHAYHDQETTNK